MVEKEICVVKNKQRVKGVRELFCVAEVVAASNAVNLFSRKLFFLKP
jgi:hypothetical protein